MMYLSKLAAPLLHCKRSCLVNNAGFSLIELMVVLAIMAVLMTLSGGLMQKSINQQTRQVELEQVKQLFKKLTYQAYYGEGQMHVRLEQNRIKILYIKDNKLIGKNLIDEVDQKEKLSNAFTTHESKYIDFKQLTFVAQDFTVSSKGIITPNHYQVFGLSNIKTYPLESLFNEFSL